MFGSGATEPTANVIVPSEAIFNLTPGIAIHQPAIDNVVPVVPAGLLLHPGVVPFPQMTTARPAPETTFTPKAVGLRIGEGHRSNLPLDVQSIVVGTISRFLAVGSLSSVQSPSTLLPTPLPAPTGWDHCQDYSSYQDSVHSGDLLRDDDDHRDMEFFEDKGLTSERPPMTRLFQPSLFKSLLHKAKVSTNLISSDGQPESSKASRPHEGLFKVLRAEKDFIPCPQLFSKVVQRPWGVPGSLAAPNTLDKKLYCSAPNLQELLHLPSIDAPVAQLTSSLIFSNDVADCLRSEDRQTELVLRKNHQAAAWAIKAATLALFFSRASII